MDSKLNRFKAARARRSFTLLAAAFLIGLAAFVQLARANESAPLTVSQSPYFAVLNADPSLDQLPLKATHVKAEISGVIAKVTVTQRYANQGTRPIHARYVFPASERAAVHGMSMRVAGRITRAKIHEKQAAQAQFEVAKSQGKSAALLEAERPNVFQMQLANIAPGEEVQVELRYTELLIPRDGVYSFVYPTVVGPRYVSPKEPSPSDKPAPWTAQPFFKPGLSSNADFELELQLSAPVPIAEISSASHRIAPHNRAEKSAALSIKGAAQAQRDIVVDYRLSGAKTESGTLVEVAADGSSTHFLAMIAPPKFAAPTLIKPREYIFVVDISGSMHGFPLNVSKKLMAELLGNLRPSDRFNVLLFSGSASMLSNTSLPATQASVSQALALLNTRMGSGGTELVPALRLLNALPKADEVSRTVVVITDGYVSVEPEVFKLVRDNLQKQNVFAFGIGSSVNRHLIDGIGRAGRGESFVLLDEASAKLEADRFRRMVEAPLLTQLSARFEGVEAQELTPAQLPDLLANRPILISGKLKGAPRGRLILEARGAAGPFRAELDFSQSQRAEQSLSKLWAREKIAELQDEFHLVRGEKLQAQITALGLEHSLLTPFTSFLAVDETPRTPSAATEVTQPSAMPDGVGASAVGQNIASSPEPGQWAAALVVLALLGFALNRKAA